MKTLLVCAVLATTATAWACPQPPPMRAHLRLGTPDGATIPGNGGLLVTQSMEPDYGGMKQGGAAAELRVRTTDGTALTPAVDYLGDGIERWRFPTTTARDLEVLDDASAVIAMVHQVPTARRALAAPRVKRLTSTAAGGAGQPAYGVPGSHMVLDLALAAPSPDATLIAELVGAGPWFTAAAPVAKRIVRDTYAGKGCSGGPGPVLAGSRLRFAWLGTDGRMSAWSRPTTVVRVRAP
ncbi:MAG: hypothetical protein IPL61_13615 [Myxococcales bacterium]|nr:hypothetical protein [Myxococcales bacterium]